MQDHLPRLVTVALDNFDASGKTVAALVRQAARLAALRQDFSAQYRFQLELLKVQAGAAKTDPVIDNIVKVILSDVMIGREIRVHVMTPLQQVGLRRK